MSDCRLALIHRLEENLVAVLSPDQVRSVVNNLTIVLSDYEVTERCTEIVPYEDANEKILKRYVACLTIDGKSVNTINGYKYVLNKLSDFSSRPLTELGTYEIRYFLACEKERGLSNRSLENYRSYISAFYAWLTVEEVINKNPMLPISPISCKKEIRLPFSDVEIDRLRCACKNSKERAIIEALLSTGVRVNELAMMKIEDIDFDKLDVYVRNGKGGNERKTYTTAVAAAYIKKYISERKDDGVWLLYNRNHSQLQSNGIRKILNSIAKRADVTNVHPHRFRRTFATGLAKKGMDIREIKELLGHANINTTMQYVYTDDDNVKASYKKYIA